jgi:hypothetical protein
MKRSEFELQALLSSQHIPLVTSLKSRLVRKIYVCLDVLRIYKLDRQEVVRCV